MDYGKDYDIIFKSKVNTIHINIYFNVEINSCYIFIVQFFSVIIELLINFRTILFDS